MVLQGETSIREVIPFPKTQSGLDPMTGAPTWVEAPQLAELGIDLTPEARRRRADEGSP
jgi:aspartyl-tRNA synthetase